VEYFVARKVSRINLVNEFYHFLETAKLFVASVVLVYDPGAAGGKPRNALEIRVRADPLGFAVMMVKPELATLYLGYIRQYVVRARFHKAVLNIFGMYEFPVVNYSHVLKQGAACQAVKVGSG
jgi:hypothetical protein